MDTSLYNSFDPYKYRDGAQEDRILRILMDYEYVPLPFFLRLEPRIANHTTNISSLRKKGWVIENFKKTVKKPNGMHEVHSYYKLDHK
jgi:hypothetical protein